MKQLLEQRLKELRAEFESGQKMTTDLENKQVNLRDTLLRISGVFRCWRNEMQYGIYKIP